MPGSLEDVENYLIKLGRKYEKTTAATPEDATLLVHASGGGTLIALRAIAPILAIHVEIGPEPTTDARRLALYRRLLELNAEDLMHAAYGLENGRVVLSAALALENLDANEVEATLSDIDLALARHTESLTHLARD
jgi:hypothetical protein